MASLSSQFAFFFMENFLYYMLQHFLLSFLIIDVIHAYIRPSSFVLYIKSLLLIHKFSFLNSALTYQKTCLLAIYFFAIFICSMLVLIQLIL